MIKLTHAKTGEVKYVPERHERISVEQFKNMTYNERLELYNSDRDLYDSLAYQLNGVKPKTSLADVNPHNSSMGIIIRKE